MTAQESIIILMKSCQLNLCITSKSLPTLINKGGNGHFAIMDITNMKELQNFLSAFHLALSDSSDRYL